MAKIKELTIRWEKFNASMYRLKEMLDNASMTRSERDEIDFILAEIENYFSEVNK